VNEKRHGKEQAEAEFHKSEDVCSPNEWATGKPRIERHVRGVLIIASQAIDPALTTSTIAKIALGFYRGHRGLGSSLHSVQGHRRIEPITRERSESFESLHGNEPDD
jgi:hypothetical protein